MTKMPINVAHAIKKYSPPTCREAFHRNDHLGEGPHTIALTCPGIYSTAAANAAINAGRWLSKQNG
jgi:hypothetical protein